MDITNPDRKFSTNKHPVFPFKKFAADLLISINELLISINVVSASIFTDINK